MILTNITLPETLFNRLRDAKLANRSFFLRSTLVAFESSDSCNSSFISSLPDLGKCLAEVNGKMVKATVPVKFSKAEYREHKKIAKNVSEESVSLLMTAAVYWATKEDAA